MTTTTRQQYREVLTGLAAKTLTRIPALNGRTEKACKLVLQGDVVLLPDGTAQVGSLTDPAKSYLVGHGACDCRDWDRAPEHLCAHRLAVGFARKVHELVPQAPKSTLEVHQGCTTPLPEAPCSVNVHLTIAGRQVQLTLRDHDEARLLVRLEEVLQRFPQPQAPAPPASQGKEWCPKHGVQMHWNEGKDGRKGWYSHRTEDGWCKGR